jgi:hypothetical protein
MAGEELGGRHQVLKRPNLPNFPTVFRFIPFCSTFRDGCGRTGRQASNLKVAKFPQLFSVSVHPVLHPAMAGEEQGGGHQILKWPNSPTVLCVSPSCSTSRDGCGRTERRPSDLKVAIFPNCFLFQSILFYIPRWLWKNREAGIRS